MVVYYISITLPFGSVQSKKGTVIVKTKLQKRREKTGLTQVQVAGKAGISVVCYQRYEYGKRIPRADVAKLIAKALNSSVEELF